MPGHNLRPYTGFGLCADLSCCCNDMAFCELRFGPNHAHMVCLTCGGVCPEPGSICEDQYHQEAI